VIKAKTDGGSSEKKFLINPTMELELSGFTSRYV